MTTVIQSSAIDTGILAIARNALVEEAVKTGGVIQAYANALCDVFDRKDTNGKTIAKSDCSTKEIFKDSIIKEFSLSNSFAKSVIDSLRMSKNWLPNLSNMLELFSNIPNA